MPAATAILDRFLQAAEIIEMKGRSFRMKDGGRSNNDQPDGDQKKKKNSSESASDLSEEEQS